VHTKKIDTWNHSPNDHYCYSEFDYTEILRFFICSEKMTRIDDRYSGLKSRKKNETRTGRRRGEN
jgi:hypothetical protein